jgi:hypothetical protein
VTKGFALSSDTKECDQLWLSCRLTFWRPAMDRAARYTFLVCLADQMRQVLDRDPVGDPTANRIVPPAWTSRAGVAFGTSLMIFRLINGGLLVEAGSGKVEG